MLVAIYGKLITFVQISILNLALITPEMKSLVLIPLIGLFLVAASAADSRDDNSEVIRARFDENTVLWTTREEAREIALKLGRKGVGYVDVTDKDTSVIPQSSRSFPVTPSHQKLIDPLLPQLSDDNLLAYLTKLTSYTNRYYRSQTGVAAAQWIKSQFETMANGNKDVDVQFFKHSWPQPSVIATLKGKGPLADEIIVIGAHEDSISYNDDAPGADDDGSGVSNVLEIFRVLVNSKISFNRTIQFMTYSAEEVGLRGSSAIADHYRKLNAKVVGVFQADMTAYVAPGEEKNIWIISDYTNRDLSAFLKLLVPAYTSLPFKSGDCGYACSDHASWYDNGFAAVGVIEADPADETLNPYIHTPEDTLEKLDLKFSLEFAKLGLAFAVELAQMNDKPASPVKQN